MVDTNEPEVYYPSGKRNYTRVGPSDEPQAAAGANWAKHLGVKTVALLDDRSLLGRGVTLVFAQKARAAGMGGTTGSQIHTPIIPAFAGRRLRCSPLPRCAFPIRRHQGLAPMLDDSAGA